MSGNLLDTNILVDDLDGNPGARQALANYQPRITSVIVWMEVLAGVKHARSVRLATLANRDAAMELERVKLERWLAGFRILPMTDEIARVAVEVRKQTSAHLPDAVIHATAIVHRLQIITRNTKDFRPLQGTASWSGYANVAVIAPYI